MRSLRPIFLFLILSSSVTVCLAQGTSTLSFSTELSPKFPPAYYVDQGLKYFDTLDSSADRSSRPNYSTRVIRWEWYPWLKLTGYQRWMMKLDVLLTLYPTRVINRNCRFFQVQPFCRCRVSFKYKGHTELVDIYEEFTFNDAGEVTFIEAWSDEDSLLPMKKNSDPWGEREGVRRLSTKIPGLGTPDGLFNPEDKNLNSLAAKDQDLQDFMKRIRSPVFYWFAELFRMIREFFK